MDKAVLRRIQITELEIGKELKRICEKNKIQYFLDGGSLLGAIRHKGFIPWDDDMDFGMLREDYERFLRVAQSELKEQYYLQTWQNDSSFPFEYAKIRKKGTLYLEASSSAQSDNNEIWIDIFPYDYFPEGKKGKQYGYQVMRLKRMIAMKYGIKAWANHKSVFTKTLVFLKYVPAWILALPYSKEQLHRRIQKWLCLKNDGTFNYFHDGTGPYPYGKAKVSISNFVGYEKAVFEDTLFDVPVGYDKFLTELYGNYMQLPPIEKRISNHNIIDYKV